MQVADSYMIMIVREVADYLRASQRVVCRLTVLRKLPAFKVGASWWFRRSELDAWISAQWPADGLSGAAGGCESQGRIQCEARP
ncbi:MAG TPA: helix-turn-helix domain-containing protein [Burkholderiaceae bacterium]|nr:helix-turn-helix domain-containing protein [Burkholderiaceae bacterium]